MDQDATWYGGRSRPSNIVLDGDPAPPTERGTAAPTFGPCLSWSNGRPSPQLLSSCVYGDDNAEFNGDVYFLLETHLASAAATSTERYIISMWANAQRDGRPVLYSTLQFG